MAGTAAGRVTDMATAGRRIGSMPAWIMSGAAALAVVSACGGKPPPKVEAQIDDNCKANADMAQADLNFCSQGKAESCASVQSDVAQVAKVKPKNQALADEVAKHATGCQGKPQVDAECRAAADAIAKLDCAQ
jgi:hypothetical protein